MENTNENENTTNSSLKTAVAVLAILFVVAGGYIFKKSMDAKTLNENLSKAEDLKVSLTSELLKKNDELNAEISKNTANVQELTEKRQAVVDLISEVNSKKATINSLQGYKKRAEFLESQIESLTQEISSLKRENQNLIMQRDSSLAALNAFKAKGTPSVNQAVSGPNGFNNTNKIETAGSKTGPKNGMNSELAEKLYRIDIINLEANAFTTDDKITQSASNVDHLNISYSIPQSYVVRASTRPYYIQVIDPSGTILGDNQTVSFEDGVNLNYSFLKNVEYKNRVMKVSQDVKYNNLKKGKYTVKVFDKSRLVSTKEFMLK